jgi:hypothetical protein
MFGPPPPQIWFGGQPSQWIVPPQLSGASPQISELHWRAWQLHELGSPAPPHTSGALHEPQFSASPQPSLTTPHSAPSSEHSFGTH